jgi:hypothetical protein
MSLKTYTFKLFANGSFWSLLVGLTGVGLQLVNLGLVSHRLGIALTAIALLTAVLSEKLPAFIRSVDGDPTNDLPKPSIDVARHNT